MSPPANPRARVGHDFGGRFATSGLEISIRAPAWGATSEAQRRALPERVSIRAPAWGATRGSCRCPRRCRCFNPRARVGRDATKRESFSMNPSFQSTRPRGARLSPNWTNTNYSTKQSYIQAATKLTKITRPAVPQFCCQGTRANIVINQHHLPFARHRARRLAKPQGHKVSSHQNAPPFFANSSRGYIHAGYLLTHQ